MTKIIASLLILCLLVAPQGWADDSPTGGSGVPAEDNDDPTTLILAIVGGAVIVGGIIWWLVDRNQKKEVEEIRSQIPPEDVEPTKKKVMVGLYPYQNKNNVAKNKNIAENITSMMLNGLQNSENFIVQETNSLTDMSMLVLGDVSMFGEMMEIETRLVATRTGKTLFKKQTTTDNIEELPAIFEKIIGEIHESLE